MHLIPHLPPCGRPQLTALPAVAPAGPRPRCCGVGGAGRLDPPAPERAFLRFAPEGGPLQGQPARSWTATSPIPDRSPPRDPCRRCVSWRRGEKAATTAPSPFVRRPFAPPILPCTQEEPASVLSQRWVFHGSMRRTAHGGVRRGSLPAPSGWRPAAGGRPRGGAPWEVLCPRKKPWEPQYGNTTLMQRASPGYLRPNQGQGCILQSSGMDLTQSASSEVPLGPSWGADMKPFQWLATMASVLL